jgi:serine/threonine protein kinase
MNGVIHPEPENEETVTTQLSLERLNAVAALGRGAKGVVFLVRDKVDHKYLALKVILRDSIEKNKKNGDEYKRVCFEQSALKRFNHPLLPRLHGVLDTKKVVGYAIDYCPGRDLNFLRKIQSEKMFSPVIIRFYAAELILALEYLHNLGIAYRDLKPENIMIQENGHIMLVDYDLSTKLPPKSVNSSPSTNSKPATKTRSSLFSMCLKKSISPIDSFRKSELPKLNSEEKSNSFVGTEEYVAPEIIQAKGHDFAVDLWSLGVVLYEMLYGVTPFKGENRKETFFRILTREPELIGERTALRDLIRKLLEKDPKQRITMEEIKGHDFFKGIDWDSVLRISRPPYIPPRVLDDRSGEDEDKEGIKKIDVESFVQGVFSNSANDEKKLCVVKPENEHFLVF